MIPFQENGVYFIHINHSKCKEQVMPKPLVMIVDDDPHVVDIVSHLLNGSGYRTVAASDPEEALRIARTAPPAVAILDVRMPRYDGFDLCSMIREHPDTAETRVVFLSGSSDETSRAQGRYSGGTAYLTKPFKKKELLQAVRSALSR